MKAKSLSAVISELGQDPESVLNQVAADKAALDAHGLTVEDVAETVQAELEIEASKTQSSAV